MKKKIPSLKTPKSICIAFFLCLLLSNNSLYAQGPTAPEASSFEPLDATDMVNLVTGDLTYILPLLNVPSPEGGYPIALAYHAGVAMDQEASWVGLGWTLNPGAINRGVNGFPDDWKNAVIKERFYDETRTHSYQSVTASFTAPSGTSVGLSISYESDKGFGGSVSFSQGIPVFRFDELVKNHIGTIGIGGTVGINPGGRFIASAEGGYKNELTGVSIGGNIGTNGIGIGVSIKSLGVGLNGNYSFTGEASVGLKAGNIGLSFSSSGISMSISGVGVAQNINFNNSIDTGDYNSYSNEDSFQLVIPTPLGTFSLGYRRQYIKTALNKTEIDKMNGPIYFNNVALKRDSYTCDCGTERQEYSAPCPCPNGDEEFGRSHDGFSTDFMDVYETNFNGELNLERNNFVAPAYDNYNISAQGLSGSMAPTRFENGALVGLSKEVNADGGSHKINYNLNVYDDSKKEILSFGDAVYFNFKSGISTNLIIDKINFSRNNLSSSKNIHDYIDNSNINNTSKRNRNGHYIDYFTNEDIINGIASSSGLLLHKDGNNPVQDGPSSRVGVTRSTLLSGIGGYKITAPDGKTYHYSLPVYNHETVQRSWGMIDNKEERRSYFENQQLKPYATHWLLTAITGPGYVKNDINRMYPEEGDYGYWVRFDYGKWSDAFAWKFPYDGDFKISSDDPSVKTRIFGRKQLYYLNKIKTRTHTALFVKKMREDGMSPVWESHEVNYDQYPSPSSFDPIIFKIPSQNQLALDKIILVKNSVDNTSYSSGVGVAEEGSKHIGFIRGKSAPAPFHLNDNVLDVTDNISNVLTNAVKVIDFSYNYNLVKDTPHSSALGRLTLEDVVFKGKNNVQLIPPYSFEYENSLSYNKSKSDPWGYHIDKAFEWSLKKITDPVGGHFNIVYESDQFRTMISPSQSGNVVYGTVYNADYATGTEARIIGANTNAFPIGKEFLIKSTYGLREEGVEDNSTSECNDSTSFVAVITNVSGDIVSYNAIGAAPVFDGICGSTGEVSFTAFGRGDICEIITTSSGLLKEDDVYTGGGLRVKSLTVTDNITSTTTMYNYNKPNGTTSGIVSYIPLASNSSKDVPFGSELPDPITMYGNVSTKTIHNDLPDNFSSETTYRFKVLDTIPTSSYFSLKIGDLFEMSIEGAINDSDYSPPKTEDQWELRGVYNKMVNNFSSLGQLLEMSSFNKEGQLLSKKSNKYKDKNDITQGIIQESYQAYKEVDYNNRRDRRQINSTTKITYPSVLESTTITQGGFTNTTTFDKYDLLTGQVLETRTYASDGTAFKTKIVPAYTKYTAMGSKVDDITNKNMLTQQAASYTYLLGNTPGDEKIVGAGITTWNNDWTYRDQTGIETTPTLGNEKIWRKHKTYVWEGAINEEGIYTSFTGEEDNFVWGLGLPQTEDDWKEVSETTRYDHYSMSLESKDINNNFAATKMGDTNTKIIAVANAAYVDMYYSGGEYLVDEHPNYFDGEIKSLGWKASATAHTGNRVVAISQGQSAFEVQVPYNVLRTGIKEKFKISVWVRAGQESNVKIKNGPSQIAFNTNESIKAGAWVLLNGVIDITSAEATVSITSTNGTIELDDFRLLPLTSSMSSYVYNEFDEVTFITGANGLSTYYVYDIAGRLKETWVEVVDNPSANIVGGFKRVRKNAYNNKK